MIVFLGVKVYCLQRQLFGKQAVEVCHGAVVRDTVVRDTVDRDAVVLEGAGVRGVGVARRADGSMLQLRRNGQGVPVVTLAPTGRVVHIFDCGSLGEHGREVAVCRHCLGRGGVRNPDG